MYNASQSALSAASREGEPLLLDVAAISKMLSISQRTVKRIAAEHPRLTVKLGRRRLFRRELVAEWVEQVAEIPLTLRISHFWPNPIISDNPHLFFTPRWRTRSPCAPFGEPHVMTPIPAEGPPSVIAGNIPQQLREAPRWVLWRFEQRSGQEKPTKVPYMPSGQRASSTNPVTWSPFDVALAAYEAGTFAGIGIVLARDPAEVGPSLVGIDLDNCRDPETGALEQWAADMVKQLHTYAESSPSGRGVRAFLLGQLPEGGRRTGRVEMYEKGRFLSVTGHILPGLPATVEHRQTELDALHRMVFAKPPEPDISGLLKPAAPLHDSDDDAIIERAMSASNGDAFRRLWEGRTDGHGGDDSAADLALVNMLAFWAGPDEAVIGRLFRRSGLYRPKWERADYRKLTIGKALEGRTDYYTPPSGSTDTWLSVAATIEEEVIDGPVTLADLVNRYPNLRPPVIDRLLRRGESMNVIAAPKVGKSWLVNGLAVQFAAGLPWLGQFGTTGGNVLIVDNELHPQTSAFRLPLVVDALGVPMSDVGQRIQVYNLRGRLLDIEGLGRLFDKRPPERVDLVIMDAFYRFLPKGVDENDNGAMANIYNLVDSFASRFDCAFVLVHHSSKGNQAGKSVTDVGAGAGSQSRATDTHLVLRPHEIDNVVVLDAAVRSWPRLAPACLRWQFPCWLPAPELDPSQLKTERPRRATVAAAKDAWDADRFAREFVTNQPSDRKLILAAAEAQGLPHNRANRLLLQAENQKLAYRYPKKGRNVPHQFATVPPTPSFASAPLPAYGEDD